MALRLSRNFLNRKPSDSAARLLFKQFLELGTWKLFFRSFLAREMVYPLYREILTQMNKAVDSEVYRI